MSNGTLYTLWAPVFFFISLFDDYYFWRNAIHCVLDFFTSNFNFIGIFRILSARKQRPHILGGDFFPVFLRVADVILLISELNFKCLLSSWSYWFTMLICMLNVEPTLAARARAKKFPALLFGNYYCAPFCFCFWENVIHAIGDVGLYIMSSK